MYLKTTRPRPFLANPLGVAISVVCSIVLVAVVAGLQSVVARDEQLQPTVPFRSRAGRRRERGDRQMIDNNCEIPR